MINRTNTTSPLIIAGPCSAETREQTLETAKALAAYGIKTFRAGLWKPRTKPGGFEGVGKIGLKWLREVEEVTGMISVTEVATLQHVKDALKEGMRMVWIGARTTANPFSVQEIADELRGVEDITVLVKNPLNTDPDLWIGAIERIQSVGIRNIAAIHRGFSAYEKGFFRNLPYWHIPLEIKKRFPDLTMICDPSHIGGRRDLVHYISQQAMDMGFEGLMIESHIDPDSALSDSSQQVTPDELNQILKTITIRSSQDSTAKLEEFRREIDEIDERILSLLSKRMEVARSIGKYKLEKNIPVVQHSRFEHIILNQTLRAGELKLDEDFIKSILEIIHEESVKEQIKLSNN